MSTELAIYRNVVNPLEFMRESGMVLAKSRMFGCETVEQGQALSLISMTEGLPFLELRRRYHIVDGDLTMKADYMRAELRRLGGDYDWIKDGEDGIEAKLWIEFRGRRHEVSYTIEHAKKEGLVKAKSRWEKSPGDMLRARCSTKAVRMYASEVLAGFATDEEMDAIVEGQGNDHAVNGNGKSSKAKSAKTETANDVAADQDVIDVPFEDAASDSESAPSLCTVEQRNRIRELLGQLELPVENVNKLLAAFGAKIVRDLSPENAAIVIAKAEAQLSKRQASSQPINQELLQSINAKLQELNQVEPGIIAKMKAKLTAAGVGIKEISQGDGQRLLDAITGNAMEAFFGADLWPTPKKADSKN